MKIKQFYLPVYLKGQNWTCPCSVTLCVSNKTLFFFKHSKSETSQKPNLFGSPKSDEDEDLFSSTSKPSKKEPQSSPSGSSPRKPVGGVSMFGGVDPFGLGKKSEPVPG